MDNTYTLPYGKEIISIHLSSGLEVDAFYPENCPITNEEIETIVTAIRNPLKYSIPSRKINPNSRIAISINDKTRPVPNNKLLPPLLDFLNGKGVKDKNILILIATGTHTPMPENEFPLLLNSDLLKRFRVISHDCDDKTNLTYKGTTTRNTQVYVNSLFDQADFKIVVGDIEPHHFAGFSGGYKSASIGLCERSTINHNHSLLSDPNSSVGRFEDNPLRQDIEEIGKLIGVDYALNAILNEKKEILHALFGDPQAVINAGIKIIRSTQLTRIEKPYDLVIASAGGYPKDINLYQAQKALTHASLFCRDGGLVLLAAACEEGVGSQSYVDFMDNVANHAEARTKFLTNGFNVGPHKAFQFAVIAERIHYRIKSTIAEELMQKLHHDPMNDLQAAINDVVISCHNKPRIAVLPYATATIPQIRGENK